MSQFFIQKTPDNKVVQVITNINNTEDFYPVLEHYIDGVKFKTYTKDSQLVTINGVEYTPSANVEDLLYQVDATTFGSMSIFNINSFVINNTTSQSILDSLPNGIHSFLLIPINTSDQTIEVAIHVDGDIDCCIAKKYDNILTKSSCKEETALEDIKKVFSINKSINASLLLGEINIAIQKRKLALLICNSNCKCNCS